jgi:enoyl-CoA hydratase/carnithine racemase
MTIRPETFAYAHDAETGVATITLNRPERLNALTFESYAELRDTFKQLDVEPGVRAIVVTGEGRAFCSGGDVETIIGQLFARDYEGLLAFTRMTCELIANIRLCKRPVIAALNGTVAGAGAVIAAACDVRIASERAKIAFLFTKVGLAGADMGAAWLLPRLIGLSRATQLLMSGDFIDAQEAERIGLYHKVVPDAELRTEARAYAAKLAKGPLFGLAMTKDALNREASMDFLGALESEAQVQAVCMQHPDFREAYEAFKNKRTPRFQG